MQSSIGCTIKIGKNVSGLTGRSPYSASMATEPICESPWAAAPGTTVTLGVQTVARNAAQRANGYYADGGRTALAIYDTKTPELIAAESARIAAINLGARETPAGEMPVVVGAGGGGVLLHEAVGHGLESDFNRQGTSLYSGRVGQRVASELVTIFDDGNLAGERGSVAVDDEGMPGEHKVLVENGILRGYMQDRLNAKLMGVASTGSGRRQSFRVMPQPRMWRQGSRVRCGIFQGCALRTQERMRHGEMTEADWWAKFGRPWSRITQQILPAFSDAVVAQAREKAKALERQPYLPLEART